jgi:AcrR family transcriptional regulator
MARPKSEDKRNAILAAAIQVIDAQGVGAPTAKIAKTAGVAEGTLFTYFASKDELLNQLYLDLKMELRDVMTSHFPRAGSIRERAQHVWNAYVDWGVAHPHKRKVMALLGASHLVTDACKAAGMEAFADVNATIHEAFTSGVLRNHPPAFVSAIMASIAETTMDFIAREPKHHEQYRNTGFDVFWHAVAAP